MKTRFTSRFGCKFPLVLAPMIGATGGRLAAAVARAGGFPLIAGGHGDKMEALAKEVALYKELAPADAKLGIGLVSWSAVGRNKVLRDVLASHKPDVLQFTAPGVYHPSVVAECRAHNALVMAQVNTVAEAKEAAAAGVDAVIVQGGDAGGHSLRAELGRATIPFAAAVVSALQGSDALVLCAGGLVDGRGLVAGLAVGCDAVVMGTRFWACEESTGNPTLRKTLATVGGDDTVRTRVFDMMTAVINAPYGWPAPFDSMRAVRNAFTERWHGREAELEAELKAKGRDSPVVQEFMEALKAGNASLAYTLTGEGVDLITNIDKAEDVVARIMREAQDTIKRLNQLL